MSVRTAVTEKATQNPPRTLSSLLALALPPLTLAVTRLVEGAFADDPEMKGLVLALALGAVVFVVERLGKFTQRFTEPRAVVDELLGIQATASFSGGAEVESEPDLPPVPDPDLPPIPDDLQ